MKIVCFSLLMILMSSFSQNKFCGVEVDISEIRNLGGKEKLDATAKEFTRQLYEKCKALSPEDEYLKVSIKYSSKDTVLISISDIFDENTALQYSCIVADSDIAKEMKVVYAKLEWEGNRKILKY